jgi:hypothetical protein
MSGKILTRKKASIMPKKLTTQQFLIRAQKAHDQKWKYDDTNYVNKTTKITFWCDTHGSVEQLPTNHIKFGCPFCSSKRHNTYSFLTKCNEKYSYDYSNTTYQGIKKKITFKCPDHGIINQLPNEHLSIGCPKCAGKKNLLTKHTSCTVLDRARKIHGHKYDYPDLTFTTIHDKIPIICKIHGIFIQRIYAHINEGQGCPKCGIDNKRIPHRKTTDQFIRKAKSIFGDLYDYSEVDYKNRRTHVKIGCKVHGIFLQQPILHLRGHKCPLCSGRGPSKYNRESFEKAAIEKHGLFCDYSQVKMSNVHDKITLTCPIHGEFKVAAYGHLARKYSCPICAGEQSSSVEERQLRDFIAGQYSGPVLSNDRRALGGMEIDVYLPQLNLGFEYHGLYWHHEGGVGRQYHLKKDELAVKANINLIQIFEHEWEYNRAILESMICSRLGVNKRIFARKTKVSEISSAVGNAFFSKTHLQGADNRSSIFLGLEYNGDLKSCMSFGKPRFSNDYEWELIRYSSKLKTNVIGGPSKLFAAFRMNHSGTVISFANRRFSLGGVYKQMGLTLDGTTPPGYFYYHPKTKKILNRIACQKHKLKNMNHYSKALSEYEIMSLNGYVRVWDAGNYRFLS